MPHPPVGEDAPALLIFLLVDLSAREPLVQDAECAVAL